MARTLQQKITDTEETLAELKAARTRILTGGQSYSIANRSLEHARLDFISSEIHRYEGILTTLERGNRIIMKRAVPRDGI